jgi:hypothetical protein
VFWNGLYFQKASGIVFGLAEGGFGGLFDVGMVVFG